MTESELVDTNTKYADVSDVERYIRSYTFDANSDPTQSQVQEMLLDASEEIDKRTNRAWRTRKVTNMQRSVKFSEKQKSPGLRDRERFFPAAFNVYGLTVLPHVKLQSVDKVEAMVGAKTRTLTEADEEIRVNERRGNIEPRAREFAVAPLSINKLQPVDQPKIIVDYTYGETNQTPRDIKKACAKIVAAELIESDQYGEILPSEAGVEAEVAAGRMRDDVDEIISEYEYVPRV